MTITPDAYRVRIAQQMTEAQLQSAVVECAKRLGWRVYHTLDSRGSESGYPDLCMVHAGQCRVLWAELKSKRGQLSPTQHAWLYALTMAGQEAHVWRPKDWLDGTVERVLREATP